MPHKYMLIRPANQRDTAQLLALRNYYIENSFAVFDEVPMTEEMIANWLASFDQATPYRLLVAENDNVVLGYASSQRYRAHQAFLKTIETSIYTAPGRAKKGVGSALYTELFTSLARYRLHRAVVGIALPNEESIQIHTKFGFKKVGVFDEYALKNGKFISSVWMQKLLHGPSDA